METLPELPNTARAGSGESGTAGDQINGGATFLELQPPVMLVPSADPNSIEVSGFGS